MLAGAWSPMQLRHAICHPVVIGARIPYRPDKVVQVLVLSGIWVADARSCLMWCSAPTITCIVCFLQVPWWSVSHAEQD
jgi:hypothetical protein